MPGTKITPSVTPSSSDPHVFREQIQRVQFASRLHIDLMDGIFAPNKNLNPIQLWWPDQQEVDIHLMYKTPIEHLETLISLKPRSIILHCESDGDVEKYLAHIKKFGIIPAVAILADTSVESAHGCIQVAEYVLLFAGKLGYFGGTADLNVLKKVPEIRKIKPDIEIGWDGGANSSNIRQISGGGVDIITVGGAIQRSDDPEESYNELCKLLL